MAKFVILHTENPYLDPGQNHDSEDREINQTLFPKIVDMTREKLTRGVKVYYLAHCSKHPFDEGIYEGFKPLMSKMQFLPTENALRQFLRCKKMLLEDNHEELVEIAGIARVLCVRVAELLFRGRDCFQDTVAYFKPTYEQYRNHSEEMGWTPEEFRKIFWAELNALVIEDLTDRPLPKIARFI